jgi:hypothetical protein
VAYCPLCARGEVHECQLANRPTKPGFHSITLTGGDDGEIVTVIDMYPAVSL